MECQACYNPIISDKHHEKCNTILMWQYSKFTLKTFQNAMTYGLCGCTVSVFISSGKVHMMHDPSSDKVLRYIQQNYDIKSGNTILLKVPQDAYKYQEPRDKIWEKLKHLPVEFSLYSMLRKIGDKFNSSLYVKRRDDGIYYTGLWGEWKLLLKTTSIGSNEKANTDIKIAVSQTPTSQKLPTTVAGISTTVPDWLPLLKAKIEELERFQN